MPSFNCAAARAAMGGNRMEEGTTAASTATNDEKFDSEDLAGLIITPHDGIKTQPKHKWAVVRGKYAYYHYGQHSFDDAGWGCAYRSFQTVCSWLKFQNHIDASKPIPSHRQIQQCLVAIGDKTPNFVGSNKWIGSLELSFCLDSMFNISSKILSSKSGADLGEHARALIYHFESGGSPVMIGGGQLAHTILGVDYNVRLGDCQYLVLDPHYTGRDNLDEVLEGGWCAWKPASFWSKKDFFNLLLPINPPPNLLPNSDNSALFKEQCVTKELVNSLTHTYTLNGHVGCVNSISWNVAGTLLVSGSDDQHVLVWREDGRIVQRLNTSHTNNIFSVLFIPHARDRLIVSASGDAQVLLHDLEQQPTAGGGDEHRHIQRWECGGRVKKLATCAAEPRLFWSTSEDGVLRQYDLRDNRTVDLLNMGEQYQLKSLASNETRPEMIAVGVSEAMVPVYDRRNMNEPVIRLLPANLYLGSEGRFLATHLAFNKRGDELIVNISSDNIYIFDVRDPNKHSSPDVLFMLKSFLSDDSKDSAANQGKNGTIPSTKHREDDKLLSEISQLKKTQELSGAIDQCSQLLSLHWGSFIHRLKILSKQLPDKAMQQQFAQLQCRNAFLHCLCTRACCFFERGWDGDQMDCLRDCLTVLRLSPTHKLAHFLLVKSLATLKQMPLATECFTYFCKLHHSDEHTAELELLLGEKKHEEGEFNLWTQEYDVSHRDYVQRYTGHLNINTDIKEANWFGPDDQYIVAGSDCGSMFIWERKTQCVVRTFKGDHYTVNCCQPHPQRCLIASSGIDDVIRFWEPASTQLKQSTEEGFPEEAERRNISEFYELMKRNRRVRTPELVWEQLLNSVGLGLFQIDSTREDEAGGNDENGGGPEEAAHVIQCQQM
ncbi:WD and tetratricopeptide repeat protein [Globodera pallida]|nr:WD and tetratricopeptide repeat protein [Globodera pallida]